MESESPCVIIDDLKYKVDAHIRDNRRFTVDGLQEYSRKFSELSSTTLSQFKCNLSESINQSSPPESTSELYRPSDRRLPAKLVSTLADKRCHMVSVTDPYGRNLDFLYQDQLQYRNIFTSWVPKVVTRKRNEISRYCLVKWSDCPVL
jgi:hypothetical protein